LKEDMYVKHEKDRLIQLVSQYAIWFTYDLMFLTQHARNTQFDQG